MHLLFKSTLNEATLNQFSKALNLKNKKFVRSTNFTKSMAEQRPQKSPDRGRKGTKPNSNLRFSLSLFHCLVEIVFKPHIYISMSFNFTFLLSTAVVLCVLTGARGVLIRATARIRRSLPLSLMYT